MKIPQRPPENWTIARIMKVEIWSPTLSTLKKSAARLMAELKCAQVGSQHIQRAIKYIIPQLPVIFIPKVTIAVPKNSYA